MNILILIMSLVLGAVLTMGIDVTWAFDTATLGLYFLISSSLFYQFFSNEARP